MSPEAIDVLLVGGGGIIAPDKLSGVSQIIRPPFFDVANAVGAAMAKGRLPAHSHCANSPTSSQYLTKLTPSSK